MEIYKITCKQTNKVYIGSTKYTKEVRWGDYGNRSSHLSCARDGDTRPLYEDIRKYGEDQFILDTLEEVDNRLEAYRREDYWIKEYAKFLGEDMLYNQYNSACGHKDWSVPYNREYQKRATESREIKYGTANGAMITEDSIMKAKETKLFKYGTLDPLINHPESRESQKRKVSKSIMDNEKGEIIYGYQKLTDTLKVLGYEEFTIDKVKRSMNDESHKLRSKYPEIFKRFIIIES